MAAAALLREPLPAPWNYGVTEDGRIFFINEESTYTTWLHPVYQHPIQSGHMSSAELPRGWEQASTPEGAPYYVDHYGMRTTFQNPVTGETASVDHSMDNSYTSQPSPANTHPHPQHPQLLSPSERSPPAHMDRPKSASRRKSGRVVGQPSATRSVDSPISMKGWLSKQDSGGLKQWRKRWFVLSDFCLFYYKGPDEGKSLGSILLPSYRINPCAREDNISRKHAFKAEHDNMRTYYFSADSHDDMRRWMNAMSLASILQRDPRYGNRQDGPMRSVEQELNPHLALREAKPDDSFRGSVSSEHAQTPTGPHGNHARPQEPLYPHHDPYESQRMRNTFSTNPHENTRPDHYDQTEPEPAYQSQRSLNALNPQDTPQYRDQPFDESTFYQPGQLQKQKPLADLSKFDSNTDINRYDGFYDRQASNPRDLSPQRSDAGYGSQPPFVPSPTNQHSQPYPQYPGEQQNQDDPRYQDNPRYQGNQHYQDDRHYQGDRWYQDDSHYQVEPQYHTDQRYQDQSQYPGYRGSESRLATDEGQYHPQGQKPFDNKHGQDRNSVTGSIRYSESQQAPEPMVPRSRQNSGYSNPSYRGESPMLTQLNQWRERVQNSPKPGQGSYNDLHRGSQQNMADKYQQNNNNPIYENLNASQPHTHTPGRPPLPVAYREQLVQDMAEAKTPGTRYDMLLAANMSNQRQMSEPLVFQYPESPPHASHNKSWQDDQQQVLPESYMKAKYEAEEAERQQRWDQSASSNPENGYPESYWRAKDKLNDQQDDIDGHHFTAQKHEPTYSTIPGSEARQQEGRKAQQQSSPKHQQTPPKSPGQTRANMTSYNTTQNTTNGFDITTIKEDPTMDDEDILVTKKLDKLKEHLNGHRLRLSISAGDLIGKSHEELVLLLIQLRRSQARLEDAQGWYRAQMDVGRGYEKEYKKRRDSEYGTMPEPLEEEHAHYQTLRQGKSQIQKQVDISKPLVNLVDNLVTMGSIYGGNNLMLASQYKQNKLTPGQFQQPKKMIEFSRRYQEDKLTKDQEEQLSQLQEDEADLEEKLQQLYQLDRELQDHSFTVTSLQEDWELLQKALEGIKKQEIQEIDPHALKRLGMQRQTIEQELSKVRQQLADASKMLEETAADNARVENEVILLRKKIMKGLDSKADNPLISESLRTKEQLEAELTSVQTMIDGLSKQGAKLGEVMSSLRRSMPDLSSVGEEEETRPEPERKSSGSTYAETDMDTMETHDLASNRLMTIFKDKSTTSRPTSHVFPQTKTQPVREIVAPPGTELYSRPPPARPSSARDSYKQLPPSGNQLNHQGSHQSLPTGSPSSMIPPYNLNTHPANLPYQGAFNGPETSPHYGHSSMTDLRQPPVSEHQRPASATFDSRPPDGAPRQSSFYSEPNLAGWSQGGHMGAAHAVSYNEPSSIAYSEPYGQNYTLATSVVYKQPDHQEPDTPDYVNIGPTGEVNSDTAPDDSGNQGDQYSPLDINDADENMKRFYGILPKEKPRATTVRDVKKRENERRSRERTRRSLAEDDDEEEITTAVLPQRNWRSQSLPKISTCSQDETSLSPSRLDSFYSASNSPLNSLESTRLPEEKVSATARLFPRSISSIRSPYDPTSSESVRRMSDILTPKPFSLGGSRPSGIRPVSMFNLSRRSDSPEDSFDSNAMPPPIPPPPSSASIATVRPTITTNAKYSVKDGKFSIPDLPRTATVKPMSKDHGSSRLRGRRGGGGAGRKGKDRDRFLTISSSQPLSMESPTKVKADMHSAAGDLITSRLQSGSDSRIDAADEFKFDDLTIDREVLFVPDKVEIPERYVPDSDDEVTEEEAVIRQEKSERIRKMLAAQSLQEWKENELQESRRSLSDLHLREELKQEKQRREEVLDIRRALAREVSQKTREVAEMHRKTVSEMELRHVGMPTGIPGDASSFASLYETPTYQRYSGFT